MAAAAPSWAGWMKRGSSSALSLDECDCTCDSDVCLEQSDAEDIIDEFISILEHSDIIEANATAQALLSDDFYEESDSINILSGEPLGSLTFAGKQSYISNVLNAPSIEDVSTIKAMPAGCRNVLWYWTMNIGSEKIPITGMNLMEINDEKQIVNQFVEFNSIAWALDVGEYSLRTCSQVQRLIQSLGFTVINSAGKTLPLA
ncbi:uncharacterized protein Z518_04737 [Rhinocladiella mackenziei CBS 650.93]|uniref:NTF2-like domain-containing protein n=1 Tax=Rhinocladiella mackenziei CBS 650.93 TaxID=1442369 RepID=A0A0D2IUC2_9EURO|nr:uncharacterized protein Z518_04737 [Rhinocladiella mackenziei CBS 650.93]KIX06761.1 hypothetical protein Z518_04737 [Rhinocladiella mackenziei CBS 650.93]